MKTYRESSLKKHISEKGINISRRGKKLFYQYDYYQVVNGYKYLFIDNVENIDDIKRKINSSINSHASFYSSFYGIKKFSNPQDLYEKVCRKICTKYGIDVRNKPTVSVMEDEIKNIGYQRHIFSPTCCFEDFIRVYLFEHELRNILLKYVLFIEERIKKVFISTLNNMEADANCLADISSYNLSRNNKNKSLGSLGKIITMHSNKNSKPILHKMEQELIVPYWIIINEMTLKQTLITANCLNDDFSLRVSQSITNELTGSTFDIFDKSKPDKIIKNEKELIKKFIDILFHLADFRNHLAHNQPVYCYNVKKHFPFQRDMPFLNTKSQTFLTNKKNGMNHIDQQRQINLTLLSASKTFFGSDQFNTRTGSKNPFDINLSWIIYAISRIVKIIFPKNEFKNNICELYKKYNIVLSYSNNDYKAHSIGDLLLFLNNGRVRGNKIVYSNRKMQAIIKKVSNDIKSSEYNPFNRTQSYYKYTGIDLNFLINILC